MHNHLPAEAHLARCARALRIASHLMFAMDLQLRRLQTAEPEDSTFVFRWQADLQFLIYCLRRIRTAAMIARHDAAVMSAIRLFDRAMPFLTDMRDVLEHIDDYAVGAGRKKDIAVAQLQVATWDGTTYNWLDRKLTVIDARASAVELFAALRSSCARGDASFAERGQ